MRNFTFQSSTSKRTNPICLAADRADLAGTTHPRIFFPLVCRLCQVVCVAQETHAPAMWRDSSAVWQWRWHGTLSLLQTAPSLNEANDWPLDAAWSTRKFRSCVVCFKIEVSASGWSLIQRCPTECGVSECNREASVMRRTWSTRGCCALEKNILFLLLT
jgi:hypothetical protein